MPSSSTQKNTTAPTQAAVTFHKLAHGGASLGRLDDGRVVFGEGILPGESASGTWEQRKKQWWLTQPVIQTASEERVEMPCPHIKQCGGCNWQHLSAKGQAHWKAEIVRESLQRLGKHNNPDVLPTLGRDNWAYRHRVTWQVQPGRKPQLGYFMHHSNSVIPVQQCGVLTPALEKALKSLNENPWVLMGSDSISAQASQNGEVLLQVHLSNSTNLDDAGNDWERWMNNNVFVKGIRLITYDHQEGGELGALNIKDPWADATIEYGVGHFMQGHPQAFTAALRWIQQQPEIQQVLEEGGTLLDAYSGVGVLGLNLKPEHQPLILVESHPDAMAYAKQNAQLNAQRIGQSVQFAEQTMEQWCKTNPELTPRWTIVDPPRQGLSHAVCQWLSQQVKDVLVYVSCDPATLARDTHQMIEHGWQLQRVQPVDLFPQTHHVESIAILSRVLS